MMNQLISLREAAEDFNAGKCQLRTTVLVRIGENETRWELVINGEPYTHGESFTIYDYHGRPMHQMFLHRADITPGELEWRPDALHGAGPREVEVIAKVFGIDPEARVWTKGSMYTKE